MRRRSPVFFLLMIGLMSVLGLRAAELTPLDALYDAVLSMSPRPSSSAAMLHARFLELEQIPDSPEALVALRSQELAGVGDPALTSTLEVIRLLSLAAENRMKAYAEGVEAFRLKRPSAAFAQAAEIGDDWKVCPDCGGCLVCPQCRGRVVCLSCSGRGSSFQKAEGFALPQATRVPCPERGGTGVCPVCRGRRRHCDTCGDAGRLPDGAKLRARIAGLATSGARHMLSAAQDETIAIAQSEALDLRLRTIRILEPQVALEQLNALDAKSFPRAKQWSSVPLLMAATTAEALRVQAVTAAKKAEPPTNVTTEDVPPSVAEEPPVVPERLVSQAVTLIPQESVVVPGDSPVAESPSEKVLPPTEVTTVSASANVLAEAVVLPTVSPAEMIPFGEGQFKEPHRVDLGPGANAPRIRPGSEVDPVRFHETPGAEREENRLPWGWIIAGFFCSLCCISRVPCC